MAAKKRGRPRRVWFRRLRQTMGAMGVTANDIAGMLGVDPSAVSRKMRGLVEWRLDEMHAVMEYLHLPVEEMYLYFPRNGEDTEEVRHRYVSEYLQETGQVLVPRTVLDTLSALVDGMTDAALPGGRI